MADASLDELGERLFSFYPPILNIVHNEWRLKKGEWSEVLVENPKMNLELWVPRAWLGEISKVDEPVMIVGLRREVEYKGGALVPYHRQVIDMPKVNAAKPLPPGRQPKARSAADEFRESSGAESSITRILIGALVAGIVITFALVGWFRVRTTGGDVEFRPVLQADLGFTGQSDYFDVVRKLGQPDEDRWRAGAGERHYRALVFKKPGLIVILMGTEQNNNAKYIGAKDLEWRTVHAVELPGGRNTEPMLRSLGKF
jgi:hypothetical protein